MEAEPGVSVTVTVTASAIPPPGVEVVSTTSTLWAAPGTFSSTDDEVAWNDTVALSLSVMVAVWAVVVPRAAGPAETASRVRATSSGLSTRASSVMVSTAMVVPSPEAAGKVIGVARA